MHTQFSVNFGEETQHLQNISKTNTYIYKSKVLTYYFRQIARNKNKWKHTSNRIVTVFKYKKRLGFCRGFKLLTVLIMKDSLRR